MDSDEEYLSSNPSEPVDSEDVEGTDDISEDQHSGDSANEGEGDTDADTDAHEGEEDADAHEGEEDADAHEGEEDADAEVLLPSHPRCRPRRKRTVTKWPEDKIVVTELTVDGMPKEDVAKARMRRLAGLIARQQISLIMASFSVLSDEDKMNLFDDYVQPRLEFAEDIKEMACKRMMQMVAKAWRTHKSHLVSNYVRKGLDATVKHTYIDPEVWEDFVMLKQSEPAKNESIRFKMLRERNKHDHHLGTGGYAGKLAQWEKEDKKLADARIANPWDQFPGRSRNFMRARGRLIISRGKAVIVWDNHEAENLSQEIVKKQAESESSGAMLVRDKDVLTRALGQPEQTGRIRGMSSSIGWKFWPLCTDMYRKRKRSNDVDVEAIKEEVALQITERVTEKVTNEVMARLRAQGLNLGLIFNTPSSAGGNNCSSLASASDAVCGVQLGSSCGIPEQVQQSPCTLVLINHQGYQVEVATGRVFPNCSVLYSVPVANGYVVVHIDHVELEHEGHVLSPPPNNEIRTLGDALYKRIQWKREWVVVRRRGFSSISANHPIPVSEKSRNLLVEPNVSCSLENDSKRQKASMAHVVGKKQKDLTNTEPRTAPQLPPSSEQEDWGSPCNLLIIDRGGCQVEVARGTVYPKQTKLYSVPVEEGYVIVLIDYIRPGQEGHKLLPCQSASVRTLGGAMYKRIQWRSEWVVVTPAKRPTHKSVKSNLNVLLGPKDSPSVNVKSNDSTVTHANMAHVLGNKENKLTNTKPASAHHETLKTTKGDTKLVPKVVDMEKHQGRPFTAAKGDTKLIHEVVARKQQQGVKKGDQKQQLAQPTKSSKRTHVWLKSNPVFIFGQPMLPETSLEKAGPGCAALHAHYMNACAQNRSAPFFAMVTSEHFLQESKIMEFPVRFEDIFDLFRLNALEMSILRCSTLCLIVEARDTAVPVGFLDPDALSAGNLDRDRDLSVLYLEKGLRRHAKKDYVMFPYNSGDHWIAVIIIPKWLKVLFIDSNRGGQTDLSGLKSVIDEALSKSQTKAKKKPKVVKLTHVPKTPCLQQHPGNTSGFYASYNMMLAMRQTKLDDSKEFDFVSTPIDLNDIREKIAGFIVEQILDQNGEFHHHEDNSKRR